MIFAVAICLGLAIGFACEGRLSNLSRVRIGGEAMLIALLFAQALLPLALAVGLSGAWLFWLQFAAMAACGLIAGINWRQPGMAAVAVGVGLNAIVVFLNTGMPVSIEAAAELRQSTQSWVPQSTDAMHVASKLQTRAPWLADVLPVPGFLNSVVSPGDILMLAGAAAFVSGHMLRDKADTADRAGHGASK
ncbi:MAG: DUF5317 family protein [Coriobacteriia bacterium]|nr:DUF5317 family protein [Coriobacteriia bacterium]